MSLEIHLRESEGIAVLDLKGKLLVGEPSAALRAQIQKFQASEKANILLNLEHLEYIDSTGLGTLVVCFTALQNAGGALKLLNLNRRNIELLVLTKLSTIFEVFDSEQEAINSFFPDREVKRFDILSFVKSQETEH